MADEFLPGKTAEQKLALVRQELCRRDFGYWLNKASPAPWRWDWPHLAYMRTFLDKVTSGEIKRLMISCPPQFGKTEQTTIRYPVWRLEFNPRLRIAVAGYNLDHASEFSRKMRDIAEERKLPLAKDRQASEHWETRYGGGIRAVGVGTGITGKPVDLLIIDDPVKSRKEAESASYRKDVVNWYSNDLYTRLQHDTPIILIMTRWHELDLAGWILKSDAGKDWTVINLPAEAEENDPLGRALGESLCSERYTKEDLQDRKRVLGTYHYTALYQGRPMPREGGMFKTEWFKTVGSLPEGCVFQRFWDKAATADDGDFTVGVLLARDKTGHYYVVDIVRGQWSAHRREEIIRTTAECDQSMYGHVRVGMEQEGGSGGKESAQSSVKNLAGFSVSAHRSTGSKEVRAEPVAAQCEAGNVSILPGPWHEAFFDEIASFPMGSHDDIVDGFSGAFNRLALYRSVYEDRGIRYLHDKPEKSDTIPIGASPESQSNFWDDDSF